MINKITNYFFGYFSKHLVVFILASSLIFGVIYYFNHLKNWNNNKATILEYIEKQLGGNVVVSGDLKFSFPVLYVPIISVTYDNSDKNLTLQDVEIKFNIFSFLIFSPKLSIITINNARIPFDVILKNKEYIKNSDKVFLNVLFHSLTLTSTPVIGNVHLQNSFLNWEQNQSFTKIALKMLLGKHDYDISAKIDKDNSQFSLKLNDYYVEFMFKNSVGKIKATGKSLVTIVCDLIIASMADDTRKIETIKMLSINDDPFVLDVDFVNTNDEIKFNKLLLQSEKIHFYLNEFKMNNKEFMCDLVVEKLDLESLIALNIFDNKFNYLLKYLNGAISNDFLGHIKFKANNITLSKNNVISDVALDVGIKDSIIDIQKFFVKISDVLKLGIIGKVQNNGIYSHFIGALKANGDDFTRFANLFNINLDEKIEKSNFEVFSKFNLSPDILIVSDFNLKTNNVNILSNMDYKINVTESKLRGFVEVYNLEFNPYNFNFNINTLTDLLGLNLAANVSIKFFNSIINGKNKIDEMLAYFDISNNILAFETIEMNAKDMKFTAKLSIEHTNVKPSLTLNVDGDNLNVNMLNLNQILKISHIEDSDKVNVDWIKENIKWFGLENVDANLSVKFKHIKFEKGNVNNFDFHAKVAKNLMTVEKLNFKVGNDTNIGLIAYLGVEQSPSIRASFVVSNLNIHNFANDILEIHGIEGYSNLSGDIVTKGENIHEMIKKLEGSIKITGNNLILKNIDFSSIAQNLYFVKSRADLENLTRVKFFQGDTIFHYINGAMNISDGMSATLINFGSDATNGIISANFSFINFMISAISKIYFYVPKEENDTSSPKIASVDVYMQGDLWSPKIFFDNNAIYDALRKEVS